MIGIAVIGLGNALAPHAKGLLELTDRARVVWGVARSAARTRAAAEVYGFPVCHDIQKAITDPPVDAVTVLTPADTQLEIAQVRTTDERRMETEDYVSALIRLGNGAPGTIIATVAAYPGSPGQIQIIGSKGTARMEGSNLRVAILDGTIQEVLDAGGSGSGSTLMGFSHLPHKAVIADFLDTIEQGRDPAIPGGEALATQRVIDMIIEKGV